MIFRVARLELERFFSAPLSWLIFLFVACYTLLSSFGYINDALVRYFLYGDTAPNTSHTLSAFASVGSGLLQQLGQALPVAIPVAFMGIISREKATDTFRLLYSSPISVADIILGKFLAQLIACAIILAIALLCSLFLIASIENVQIGVLVYGFFALYGVMTLASAVILFSSTLTKHPIFDVAAAVAIFGVLYSIGRFFHGVPIVEYITAWLSFPQRTEDIYFGYVVSRDVLYFALLTALFVFFAYQKLRYDRATIFEKRRVLVEMFSAAVCVLALGYVTSLPKHNLYADLTSNKRHSASPQVYDKLHSISDSITVTTYVNVLGRGLTSMLPENRLSDEHKFEKYLRANRKIDLEYVYFYKKPPIAGGLSQNERILSEEDLLRERLSRFRISPDTVKAADDVTEIDLSRYNYINVRVYEAGGARGVVPVQYDDRLGGPSETELLGMLESMTSDSIRVGALQDHGERSIWSPWPNEWRRAFTQIENRESVASLGLSVDELSLATTSNSDATDIMIIADPRESYEPVVVDRIRQHIQAGGDMLIAIEPNNRSLDDVLTVLGVSVLPGMLVNGEEDEDSETSFVDAAPNAAFVLKKSGHREH